jgi:uncharacterized repeat protein (TIGR01451 family)
MTFDPSPTRSRRPSGALVGALAVLAASVLSVAPHEAAVAAQDPSSCSPAVTLVNGGFEEPVLNDGDRIAVHQSVVPGWSTTAGDGQIELWRFHAPAADSGSQHAELNANVVSTLYQDVATVPGQVLKWELAHRGREGTDVMQVQLGPPAGPLVQQGSNIADGTGAWGHYSGLYTVPAGQTTTRFAFVSVSSVGGASFGNFLDSVSLGSAACLITTKSVTNTTRPGNDPVAGDVLEYTVEVTNNGGVDATSVVVTDVVPTGTTYLPESIVAPTGAVSDATGDDAGELDAGSVVVRVGDGADASNGGSIPAGESRTISFRTTVDADAVGLTVDNEAVVSFVESLSGSTATSTSNPTATPVLGSADLAVSQTLDTPLANGDPIQYTVTVTNNGPQTSTDTQLVSTLPLLGMTVTDPDCSITLDQLVCDFGSLVDGASRVVVVSGTVPSDASGGTSYELDSTVGGSTHDPLLDNNTALTPGTVANDAALTIDMTITNTTPDSAGRAAREGELLQASYLVTNTGNVDLTTLTVTDPVFGAVTCTPTSLAPGDTATCTADALYPVTAQDVRDGGVSSVATAQAESALIASPVVTATTAAAIAAAALALADTGVAHTFRMWLAGILIVVGVGAVTGSAVTGSRFRTAAPAGR